MCEIYIFPDVRRNLHSRILSIEWVFNFLGTIGCMHAGNRIVLSGVANPHNF